MTSISNPEILTGLLTRLARLTPDTQRGWGTLTAAEMLCHLGDTGESVLGRRVPPGPKPSGKRRPIIKWLVLSSPLRWPKGAATRPGVNPHLEGTKPGAFEEDRARVVSGLQALASAPADGLSPVHYLFGPMSRDDWHRWAYRHVDHHLRQFGV